MKAQFIVSAMLTRIAYCRQQVQPRGRETPRLFIIITSIKQKVFERVPTWADHPLFKANSSFKENKANTCPLMAGVNFNALLKLDVVTGERYLNSYSSRK